MEVDPEDKTKAPVYIPAPKYTPNSNSQQGAFKRGPQRRRKAEMQSSVSFLLNATNQQPNPTMDGDPNSPEAPLIRSAKNSKSDSDSLSDETGSSSVDRRKRGSGDENDKERKKKVRLLKNRQSAALSRQRKKEYITTIEQKCNTLMVENSDLQGQINKMSSNTWQNKAENEQLESQLKELTKQNEELRRANDLLLKANEVMLKSAQLNYQNNSATLQFVAANTPQQLIFNNTTLQPQSRSGSNTATSSHLTSNPNENIGNNSAAMDTTQQGHFILKAAALNVLQGTSNNINYSLAGNAQLTPQQLQGLGGLLILHQSTNNNININNSNDTTNFITNNNGFNNDFRRNPSENVSDEKMPSTTADPMKVDQSSSESSGSQVTPMVINDGH